MTCKPCATSGCVALAVDGTLLCAVCSSIARRQPGDVALYCYACGDLIRLGRRYFVRSEGVFHLRPACLVADPQSYEIPIIAPAAADALSA